MENLKKKLRFQLLKRITILFIKASRNSLYKCINKNFIFIYICLVHIKKKHLFLHKYSKKRKSNENQNSNQRISNHSSSSFPRHHSKLITKRKGRIKPSLQLFPKHFQTDHKDTHWFPIEHLAGKLESRNIPRNQDRQTNNICWIQFTNRDSGVVE